MSSPSTSALSLLLALTTPILASASPEAHILLSRDYVDEICSPNTTTTTSSSTTIPPCIEITTIEEACAPNGTAPIDYVAHAQCMCGGSYFQEWQGCQDCLFFHGLRTERDEAFYASVLSVASHGLCDFLSTSSAAAPTTDFAALFSAAEATITQPTTGATVSSDQAPGETAVSLYFTLSGSQGPGAITGSAASATATATTTRTTAGSDSASGTTASKKSSSSSKSATSASGSSEATSSSGSGAYPTKAPGGLLLGVAGVAMVVGL